MQSFVAFFAMVACASASGLLGAAPLIPRVQVAPTQVNVVKQPYTIEQPISVPRSVPYPVKAVAYTAPEVHSPIVHTAPAFATYATAPAISTYAAAPAYSTYAAAPAYSTYAAAPAYSTYAASHLAYGAAPIAAPGLLARSHIALAH